MQIYWFATLMASICLEGLGRKYLPAIPSAVLYFFKDAVLLSGYFFVKPPRSVQRSWRMLYRGFGVVWLVTLAWTVVQVFNPSHESTELALIGLRAYWLWWIAPVLVATIMIDPRQRRRAIYLLATLTIGIAILAALQFASPADSALNLYSVVDGEAQYAADSAIVGATGRARVSSTFAFLSGFSDFTLLMPALLLSLGLQTEDRKLRLYSLGATLLAAAVMPMSGSRAGVILGASVLLLTSWAAGLLFTAIGRRIMIGAIAGTILAGVAFPDALFGVQSRFDTDETQGRLVDATTVLPPVALLVFDYPAMGIGTGMQQNARASLHVHPEWQSELESQRYLVELGVVGFCLIWTTKLGLMVALLRSYKILQRAGRRAASGAALSYAAVTFFGNLTFDHIWQALFFVGCGFILAETVSVLEAAPSSGDRDRSLVPVSR
jgi:hypothetical protein